MKITLAQIELKTGDLRGNTDRILKEMNRCYDSDVILFPELSVTGYNCGSLFESDDFINDARRCVDEIVAATEGSECTVIFGAPRFANPDREPNGNVRLHNSAFIARNGKLLTTYDKILLANDFQHEDRKYFVAGSELVTVNIAGKTAGILICEDIWAPDHDVNLVEELKVLHPDLSMIFCINYSYFTYDKNRARRELLSKLARAHEVAIFYVNAVGVGDIVKNFMTYDGRSLVYRKDGMMVDTLAAFASQTKTYNWVDDDMRLMYSTMSEPSATEAKYTDIWKALNYALPRIMDQTGIQRAQVHVSGGIDSAVVAALCAKALGSERCVFISNPSQYNGDVTKGNAQYVANKLDVPLYWMPIGETTSSAMHAMKTAPLVSHNPNYMPMPLQSQTLIPLVDTTLDAVGRTLIGLSISHQFKSSIISTGNQTENVLGWFTFHDVGSVGLFQPLGDLTKSEVEELAEYINRHYQDEIIPSNLYDGTTLPMAELADSKVDPFDYPLYSGICAEMIRKRMTVRDLEQAYEAKTLSGDYFSKCDPYLYSKAVFMAAARDSWARSKRSVYKCAQSAPPLILSNRSRGFSSRETILNHYNPEA